MEPLPTCQLAMMWLCMCPADESTSKKKRICYAAFTLFVGSSAFFGLLTTVGLFVKYASVDLEIALYAIYQVSANAAMLNMIIIGVINRHRIAAIFTELSKLYAANETEATLRFAAEANNKSEWLWKLYIKFGIIGLLLNMYTSTVASLVYCFYKYGALYADHLYKPLKFLFPFNQHTLYGYFIENTFGIISGETYMILNGAVLLLFISMCWHHHSLYQKFCYIVLKLDQTENKQNTNKILCELFRFHINTKDWFTQTAEVYSPLVLIQLICNVIFMSAVTFELDLRTNRIDLELLLLLNAAVCGFSNLFFYCYFGKLATESYEQMAEYLYESNWHELSPDLQKKVLLMIQNMQRPVYYHGFGVAVLNLLTFLKVLRAVVSYYMAFKTLNK